MPVDPALAGLLAAFDDGSALDVAQARAGLDDFASVVGAGSPPGEHEDDVVAAVPVRRYRPLGERRAPALVWFHGGGWVAGSLAAVDPLCRALVARTGAPLTSAGYRLAPEHPFPAAVDDAVAVVRAEALRGPVAVGGDSAGAGLAAASCLLLQDEALPLLAHVLVTPLLDATLSSASVTEHGEGQGLTRIALQHFTALYLQGADPSDARCSPLLADDVSGLPPAVVVTAEADPLRDEGDAYARRLTDAGVPVAHRCYERMVHGFAGMSAVTPVAGQALDWVVDELARLTGD